MDKDNLEIVLDDEGIPDSIRCRRSFLEALFSHVNPRDDSINYHFSKQRSNPQDPNPYSIANIQKRVGLYGMKHFLRGAIYGALYVGVVNIFQEPNFTPTEAYIITGSAMMIDILQFGARNDLLG